MSEETGQGKPPAGKFRDRGLTVTIWKNEPKEEGKSAYYSANLTKSYMDGEIWKETTSLNADDILRAANLLQQAYNKILELKAE